MNTDEFLESAIGSLISVVTDRFGKPTPEQEQLMQQTRDMQLLHTIHDNLLSASSWDELLHLSLSETPSS